MGFHGTFVVGRSPKPLTELLPVSGVRMHVETRYADGWQVVRIFDMPDLDDELGPLREATGAPMLTATVIDSDCAQLFAMDDEPWRTYLDPETNKAYLGEYVGYQSDASGDALDQEIDEAFSNGGLSPDDATQKFVRWAALAGYNVPAGPIKEILEASADPFVEDLFYYLLLALGLTLLPPDEQPTIE